uniref:Uncharacterized protein n=1 Tax=Hyaloperonospora arabidopsidis (strain Emoy2) TaxID=559515 RepID=M4BPK5_HYAAE
MLHSIIYAWMQPLRRFIFDSACHIRRSIYNTKGLEATQSRRVSVRLKLLVPGARSSPRTHYLGTLAL